MDLEDYIMPCGKTDPEKRQPRPEIDKIKILIGTELSEEEFEFLKKEDKSQVKAKYESSKKEIAALKRPCESKVSPMVPHILKISLRDYSPIFEYGLKQGRRAKDYIAIRTSIQRTTMWTQGNFLRGG